MINFTLKNLPDYLHKKLKKQAKIHHRSLNSEIIAKLEESIERRKIDVETILNGIRSVRSRINGKLTDAKLSRYKNIGRL